MTDEEWEFFRSYVASRGRGRPPADHRRVLDGVFWVAISGRPWRELPRDFGIWGSVYRQYQRWSATRVWQHASEDVAGHARRPLTRPVPQRVIIEQAAAAAGGRERLLQKIEAARLLGERPRSTHGVLPRVRADRPERFSF